MHNVTHDTFEPIEMVQKVAAVTFYPILPDNYGSVQLPDSLSVFLC